MTQRGCGLWCGTEEGKGRKRLAFFRRDRDKVNRTGLCNKCEELFARRQ